MAYAAVTSLMGTLHLHFLQSQPRLPLKDNQEIVNSLYENLDFLQESLEKSEICYDNAGAMKDLEAEMRDVLFKAEERIEMELSTIYLQSRSIEACSLLRLHGIFNQALKQTDYLKTKIISEEQLAKGSSQVERIADVSLLGRIRQRRLHLGSTSSQPDLELENIKMSKFSKNTPMFDSRMVGCEEEFKTIMDQLTRQSVKQLQVVSIVGMGGIGKTTLARKVYEDPSITSHFYMRAWVTVSQEYNVEQMLRCLLDCVIAASRDEHPQHSKVPKEQRNPKEKLPPPERLRKLLKEQRYLIVIDDIWSTSAWDSLQRCFPDDNTGSRILLTSRLKKVAEYASSGNSPLNMCLLDMVQSWNLYCKVFGKTEFPFGLEQIGRYILNKCEGLPLAIIVVASLLSKMGEKEEKWMIVAKNVSRSVIGGSNDVCLRILSLSYNQLPHHLKACFLYFGIFPEDYEIRVKILVRLWAAEGFLGAVKHQNTEEVAMEWLQDLVDRSLVIVSKQSYNGEMKTIRIHDLLRDFCLTETRRENLLNVIEKLPFYKRISQHLFSEPCRWISYTPGSSFLWLDNQIRSNWLNKSHSIHSSALHFRDMKHLFSHFKLLRVLDIEIVFGEGHGNALNVLANLVHLRYLALSTSEDAFSFDVKLFEHWNMQSFIVRSCAGILDCSQASQIWKMSLLRNFYVRACFSLETSEVIHRNLQTIFWLDRKCCTNDLFKRIPNLKKLGIRGGVSSGNPDYFYNLFQLGQLEKLSIRGWHPKGILCNGIQWETNFLPTLKKLIFKGTGLPWCDMRFIGMLPNLEVLKLINACEGPKWEPSEGGFRRLKMLVIEEVFLNCWDAVGDHFPVLECLELRKCYWLQEIPSGFVDITTLALIQLKSCEDCLLASTKRIQDEQHSYGNHALLGPEPTMLYNEGWYEAWIMMADFRNAEKPLNLVEAHGWWTFLNLHRKMVSASEKKLLLQYILLYRKKLNRQ